MTWEKRAGFQVDTNVVRLLYKDGLLKIPLMTKCDFPPYTGPY